MLILLSIADEKGDEIFTHRTERYTKAMMDSQLLSDFMEALRVISASVESPLQQIQLANLMLYVRNYGDFSVRFVVEEKLNELEAENYFSLVSKEIMHLLVDQSITPDSRKDVFQKRLLAIIAPLVQDPLMRTKIEDISSGSSISKIALVGLGNAGKTTIKKVFFDRWPADKAKNVTPTIGIETSQKFLEFLKQNFLIMDFGGQVAYQKLHLAQEEHWSGVLALIYVVDLQDSSTFEAASTYLKEVWQLITRVNKRKPKLAIFLHKMDPEKSIELKENIQKALFCFREFASFANFHMTTIKNSSSNIAVIRTFYFSLPDVMLRKLFEEEFLGHFETQVLPKYSELARADIFGEIIKEEAKNLRKSAIILGIAFGKTLEEVWMQYLLGEHPSKDRSISSKRVIVFQSAQRLLIRIPNWVDQGIPKMLTELLVSGMLEGVLSTFHLPAPKIIDDRPFSTTWEIYL